MSEKDANSTPDNHRLRFSAQVTKASGPRVQGVVAPKKLANGQASNRRRDKRLIRFTKTWLFVNLYVVVLSSVAFVVGAYSAPLNVSAPAWQRDLARAVFDMGVWLLICAIVNRHFSLVYAKVMRHPVIVFLLGAIAVGVLLIYSACIYDIYSDARSNATPWPLFTTRVPATVARHYTYLTLVAGFPIPVKYMVRRLASAEPSSLPPQKPTVLFSIGIAATIAYWASYLAVNSVQSIMAMGTCFCLAVASFAMMSYLTYYGGRTYHRNFAFSAGMYYAFHLSRGLNRLLYILLSTEAGKKNIPWVIFAYRTSFGFLVQTMDDILEPAFGVPIVWLNFFGRIGESIASTIVFLDYSNFPDDLYLYFALNFLILVLKDAGITDDIRFWIFNKYSIFHGILEAKRSRANHPQRACPSSALALSDTELMSPSDSFSTMASDLLPDRAPPDSGGDTWTRSKGSFSMGMSGPRFNVGSPSPGSRAGSTSETSSTEPTQAPSAARATWPYTSQALDAMRLDIKVQVSRSEQTFMGRTAAIFAFYMVYSLARWLGYSIPGKVRLHERHEEVSWMVLLLLVQVFVCRVFASRILSWKTTRLQFVYHECSRAIRRMTSDAGRPQSGAARASVNMRYLPVVPSATTEVPMGPHNAQQQSTSAHSRTHAQAHAPPIIRLWTTTLPSDPLYRQVVLLGTGLVVCVTLGPWLT